MAAPLSWIGDGLVYMLGDDVLKTSVLELAPAIQAVDEDERTA